MLNHASLDAATQHRKARLAQLKSLKRKQASASEDAEEQRGGAIPKESLKRKEPPSGEDAIEEAIDGNSTELSTRPKRSSRSPSPTATAAYISGRNYDHETKGPKLGFETAPGEGQITLESQAKTIADAAKRQAEEEEKADKPLDLFKLQPKKPNWDLKRDLERKLEILNVRTDNAIARLVRERISKAQAAAKAKGTGTSGDGEAVGMDGAMLVEAMHLREREEEADERRERDQEDMI